MEYMYIYIKNLILKCFFLKIAWNEQQFSPLKFKQPMVVQLGKIHLVHFI